ncbi:MAG TPA: tetratricopeptide repeat protein [Gaiellaceae bacterium]|jgi:tetratricopeptide (TPR) repeat protein|nr:tetratricopeptide repeat protein [Gaiellaceae bacterium]
MFFPRLRNQAKWAFVFLILVFGGGFVFLGVGSGGLDLGQLLRDAFGRSGGSGVSVSEAQKDAQQHPLQPAARRSLATALESRGRIDEAIDAWTEYTKLRPKDAAALRHLGQLELSQADRYFREAQLASLAQQEAGLGSPFRPSQADKFGQALGQDPITQALSTKASTQLQQASVKYQTAASRAVATYQAIVKLRPDDEQALFSLAQAADTLRQIPVAISAYKRLLKFNLDPATAAQIRERIKTLQQSGG